MLVKTSELKGMALCYAVCRVKLPHLVWGETIGLHAHSRQIVVPELKEPDCYSPFMAWEYAGEIIESDKLDVCTTPDNTLWRVIDHSRKSPPVYYGLTPLIAVFRCYVAGRLGDTVEIPNELIGD